MVYLEPMRMVTMAGMILQGDALTWLKQINDNSIDCCVTSPPYWGLRDYKHSDQLGQEATPNEYINHLIEIFAEVKRVIKKTGSIFVNIGDTYAAGTRGKTKGDNQRDSIIARREIPIQQGAPNRMGCGIQDKSLCGIPERFAIAMTDELGLIRRNTVIWYKPNCMPSSASDRFTVDFEYIYFFSKSPKYFFETQYEPHDKSKPVGWTNWNNGRFGEKNKGETFGRRYVGEEYHENPLGRQKRCVWRIPTKPFSGAHFAVFPPQLIEIPIKATCPEGGIVLDPFAGAGTTGLVTLQQHKNFIGIELNPDYIGIIKARLMPLLRQQRLRQ